MNRAFPFRIVLALDAKSGVVLGLAAGTVWTRAEGKMAHGWEKFKSMAQGWALSHDVRIC